LNPSSLITDPESLILASLILASLILASLILESWNPGIAESVTALWHGSIASKRFGDSRIRRFSDSAIRDQGFIHD